MTTPEKVWLHPDSFDDGSAPERRLYNKGVETLYLHADRVVEKLVEDYMGVRRGDGPKMWKYATNEVRDILGLESDQ